jgi:hypothetical protein
MPLLWLPLRPLLLPPLLPPLLAPLLLLLTWSLILGVVSVDVLLLRVKCFFYSELLLSRSATCRRKQIARER